jgi:hypothetical protein
MCTKSVLDGFLRDVTAIHPKVVVKWFRPVLEVLRHLHSLSPPIIHHKIGFSSIVVRGASGAVKVAMLLLIPFDLSIGKSIGDDTARVPVRREAVRVQHLVLRTRRPDSAHEAAAAR